MNLLTKNLFNENVIDIKLPDLASIIGGQYSAPISPMPPVSPPDTSPIPGKGPGNLNLLNLIDPNTPGNYPTKKDANGYPLV